MTVKKQTELGCFLRPALILCLAILLVVLAGTVRQWGGSLSSATIRADQTVDPADTVRNNVLTGYQFGLLCRQENMRPENRGRYHLCEAFYRQNFDQSAEAVIYLRAWLADQARQMHRAAQNDLLASVAFLTLAVVMAACFIFIAIWTPTIRLTLLLSVGMVLWAGIIVYALYATYDYGSRQRTQLTASAEMTALRDEVDARALALAADGKRTIPADLVDDYISRFIRISYDKGLGVPVELRLTRN